MVDKGPDGDGCILTVMRVGGVRSQRTLTGGMVLKRITANKEWLSQTSRLPTNNTGSSNRTKMKLMFTVMSGSSRIGGHNNKLQRKKQLKMKRRKLRQLIRTRLLMLERRKVKRKKEMLQVLELLKQRKKKLT